MFASTKPFDGKRRRPSATARWSRFDAEGPRSRSTGSTSIALANGGSDEGPPGRARRRQFYAAYFRDPAGNKLVAFRFRGGRRNERAARSKSHPIHLGSGGTAVPAARVPAR